MDNVHATTGEFFTPSRLHTRGPEELKPGCVTRATELHTFFSHRYDVNYGVTAEEVAASVGEESTIMRVATNTIYSNAMYPSHIAIPMRKVCEEVGGWRLVDKRPLPLSGLQSSFNFL